MTDEFRQKIVELKKGHEAAAKNKTNGTGVMPSNHEGELKAHLLKQVLALYDKHFSA